MSYNTLRDMKIGTRVTESISISFINRKLSNDPKNAIDMQNWRVCVCARAENLHDK